MSASNWSEAVDEILKTYQLNVAANLSNGEVLDVARDTARAEAKQALNTAVKEHVIGEDEGDIFEHMKPTWQNELRAKQRKAVDGSKE